MEITRGKVRKGVKFLVYGPEGIGKSTFVSKIPGIVFIDTEGSTGELDVPRMPNPSSWNMLLSEVDYAIEHPEEVPALVIDTGDWAERLCLDHVLQTHLINGKPMQSIEDAGYGKGYVYLYEEFGKLLDKMSMLSEKGIHCGFTAHAMMRKFEQPDELGAYDRWELKMSKKVAPLLKEWSSIMLFANYKTMVYATDKDAKKHKAAGGQRVMYANHHPCWDAKNRYGLPDEMTFEFEQVAGIFTPVGHAERKDVEAKKSKPQEPKKKVVEDVDVDDAAPLFEPPKKPIVAVSDVLPKQTEKKADEGYEGVPSKLADLMKRDGVMPFEVQAAIAQKGYFPIETPFENYPADFVNGVLIGAWDQVKAMVINNRENIPF